MKNSTQCNNDTIEDLDPSVVIINGLEQSTPESAVASAEEFISDPIAESNPDFPDLQEGNENWFQRSSITILLPIFYGATSSIMNLYYFVELERRYGVENGILGLMLALSYATRVLFSSLGRAIPKTSAFVGSILTLVGYYMMLLSVHRDMVKDSLQYVHSNDTHSLSLFVLGTTLTQCNEAMYSAMQMFIHLLHGTNVPTASSRLKSNYHTIKVSRVISFLTGGILYHLYSIDGVAALAAIMVILQILNLVAFYVVDIYRIPNYMRPGMQGHEDEQSYKAKFRPSLNVSAVRSRRRIFKTDMSKLHRLLGTYYTVDIPPSILQKIIPICVYGRSISVLCIWSSVAIIMDHDFAFNFIVIGSMMACATLIDWIASIVFLRNDMHLYFKEVFPSPRDLFYSLSGMAFSCVLMVIPLFITFVSGFFLFCIFNAILKIMLLDMQGNGGIVATDGILFTTFRRVSVGISLVCIPMLFELQSSLPMVLGLSYILLILFALILFLYRSNKVDSNSNNEDDSVCQNAMEEIEKHRSIVKKSHMQLNRCNQPEQNLQYDEQLMVASMIRGKDF
jgi:hypothetical protein